MRVNPAVDADAEAAITSTAMENGGEGPDSRSDLQPVIARLREIQRKCRTLGTRNEDFPLMEERLGAIVDRLQAGEEPGGEPLRYGEMARQLFPVAHLFESYGFLTVGKEIAHVERTLRDLGAGASPGRMEEARPAMAVAAPLPRATTEEGSTGFNEPTGDAAAPSPSLPTPVAVALLALLAAIATVAVIIVLREPIRRDLPPPPAPSVPPTAAPAVTAAPSPTLPPLLAGTNPAARLAEEVGLARLALGAGDIDAAVEHLSQAAVVDFKDASVIDTAQRIVASLLAAAGAAVERGQWELAGQRLDRGESISRRFGLETAHIESARRRIAAMERFTILVPTDTSAILAVRGRRVDIRMLDGSTRQGRVHGVNGASLLLEVDSEVGGGTVSYTDPVPLAQIRELKVYEE